jgi:hypothetical protein
MDRFEEIKDHHFKQHGFGTTHDDVEWLIIEVEALRRCLDRSTRHIQVVKNHRKMIRDRLNDALGHDVLRLNDAVDMVINQRRDALAEVERLRTKYNLNQLSEEKSSD